MMSNKQHLHPITIVMNMLKNAKQWVTTFAVLFLVNIGRIEWNPAKPGFQWTLIGLLVIAVIAIVTIVLCILSWRRFTYWFEDQELHIEKGIFVRKHQLVPFERIQSVNFKESILHRPFRLVSVTLETAGSEESGMKLLAISKQQAEWIEAATKKAKKRTNTSLEATPEEQPLVEKELMYSITKKDLLILAATSGSIGIIFSALAAIATQLSDFIPMDAVVDQVQVLVKSGITLIALLVALILFVSWFFSIVVTYIQFANFEVVREGERLLISKGVLEKKRTNVPLSRVQSIRIVESPFRQLFGFATIQLVSAGNTEEKSGSTVTLMPLIKRAEGIALLQKLFPDYVYDVEQWVKPPKFASWRYMLFYSWFTFVIVALLIIFIPHYYGAFGFILCAFAMLYGYALYKTAALQIEDNQLLVVTRTFSKVTTLVMKNRIQTLQLAQTIVAERGELARFQAIYVAGKLPMGVGVRFFKKVDLLRIYHWYQRGK